MPLIFPIRLGPFSVFHHNEDHSEGSPGLDQFQTSDDCDFLVQYSLARLTSLITLSPSFSRIL